MIVQHLTEKEIQQFATDKTGCEITAVEHLETCEYCSARVASYQLVFAAIRELPAPVNELDLSSLVMSKIRPEKKSFLPDDLFVCFLVLVALVLTGMTFYSFRSFFLQLFNDFSDMVVFLAATTFITLLLFQLVDNKRKYQHKINKLKIV